MCVCDTREDARVVDGYLDGCWTLFISSFQSAGVREGDGSHLLAERAESAHLAPTT